MDDVELFRHRVGDCAGQQTWECLCILVALRLFKCWWRHDRLQLTVASDSFAALSALLRMKASGQGPNIIARELALDLADGLYRPDVIVHQPGIANTICDVLSRKFQPGVAFVLPAVLSNAVCLTPPARTKEYYRSL